LGRAFARNLGRWFEGYNPSVARWELSFERLEHDVADYGSDEATVGSRAFFSAKRDGVLAGNYHADLSYPVDGDLESVDFAVGPIGGVPRAPIPHAGFAEEATAWARGLIASARLAGKRREPRTLLRRHAVQIRADD
jgi:hypothetical protein